MKPITELKIFSGSTGKVFAERISKYLQVEPGQSDVIIFSDGNTFVRINEPVRDKDVYLVQPIGLNPNNEFVEIIFWIDAFKRASANSITLVMPYFGYAKGDKKDEPRVSIRARVCAECIELAGVDRIITMDLHAPQIQGFFKKAVDHLSAEPLLSHYIKTLNLENLVVVSPDAGFMKNAKEFATSLNAPVAVGIKERKTHDEMPEIFEVIGDVAGKNALIVDDFSASGNSLINMAHALKQKNAKQIYAAISHVLLNESAIRRIEESPIDCLIVTDTVFNNNVLKSDKIKLISVAPLFAETILCLHKRKSLGNLFKNIPQRVFDYSEL